MVIPADDGEFIEMLLLGAVTMVYVLYFVIFLLVLWADRPLTGYDEHGYVRVWRDVRSR